MIAISRSDHKAPQQYLAFKSQVILNICEGINQSLKTQQPRTSVTGTEILRSFRQGYAQEHFYMEHQLSAQIVEIS